MDLAQYITSLLEKYYSTFNPPKRVIKDLEMSDVIQSFKLPSEVSDQLLGDYVSDREDCRPPATELQLKDETDTVLLDLGIDNIVLAPKC